MKNNPLTLWAKATLFIAILVTFGKVYGYDAIVKTHKPEEGELYHPNKITQRKVNPNYGSVKKNQKTGPAIDISTGIKLEPRANIPAEEEATGILVSDNDWQRELSFEDYEKVPVTSGKAGSLNGVSSRALEKKILNLTRRVKIESPDSILVPEASNTDPEADDVEFSDEDDPNDGKVRIPQSFPQNISAPKYDKPKGVTPRNSHLIQSLNTSPFMDESSIPDDKKEKLDSVCDEVLDGVTFTAHDLSLQGFLPDEINLLMNLQKLHSHIQNKDRLNFEELKKINAEINDQVQSQSMSKYFTADRLHSFGWEWISSDENQVHQQETDAERPRMKSSSNLSNGYSPPVTLGRRAVPENESPDSPELSGKIGALFIIVFSSACLVLLIFTFCFAKFIHKQKLKAVHKRSSQTVMKTTTLADGTLRSVYFDPPSRTNTLVEVSNPDGQFRVSTVSGIPNHNIRRYSVQSDDSLELGNIDIL